MERKWWKEAVAYQIYPRSFKDSDGDGIGDIRGIIEKLDYLEDLGIDVIWVCPVYASPNDDNGYDISDYHAIMPEFGTMEDFDELLGEVHRRDMRLIMDLVINHTSDEHPWFLESRSSKDNPYRDYYIWSQGKDREEPSNWGSIFGGSAWEYDPETKEYYLHVFSKKQPDLNWENEEVRRRIYDMINWWLDKGIDGFRIDAISHIKKEEGFPDVANPGGEKYPSSLDAHLNKEGIHSFLKELKEETFDHYDVMTVGEANGVESTEAAKWVGEEEGKFSMIFQFESTNLWSSDPSVSFDIFKLKETFQKWQENLEGSGWNALFLENHDLPRSVSVWADDEDYRERSAKALATFYFLMKGTPFIYQGQEIGMTNIQLSSIEEYDDIIIKNMYSEEREKGVPHEEIMKKIWRTGRDNSRTPMQWSDQEHAGFTSGRPWMTVNPNHRYINVQDELEDDSSVLHYYKRLIRLRKSSDTLLYGRFVLMLPEHDRVFAYKRVLGEEAYLVIINLFNEPTTAYIEELSSSGSLVMGNKGEEAFKPGKLELDAYEARVYLL